MLVTLLFFVLLPFCYICYKKYEATQYMKNIPCMPERNFLFGNLLSIKWKKNYSDLLDIHNQLLKELGPVYKVCILAYGESLVVADPKFADYILSSQKLIDKSTYHAFLDSWIGTGLLTGGGAKWRRHRRLIAPSFHFSILRDFIDVFENVSKVFIEKLNQELGKKSVNIPLLVSLCTLDIICEATMGVKLNAQTRVSSDYIDAVKTMCKIFISRIFFPIPKYLYCLTPNFYKERKAVKILHNYSNTVVRNKIKENSVVTAENYDGNDVGEKKKLAFLDHLLHINAKGEVLTTAELREEIDTVMFAGHDTVSVTISYALYCLAQHQEIQEKVVEEQKAIFSDFKRERVTLEHLNEMNYLELVIKECLRLYPPVPFLGRFFSEEVEWGGNVFPQGLNVLISIYAIHRNEEIFPDAEKFYPERFAESSNINSCNYLPFSNGPRNCIGQKFAMLELKTVLSKVIRNFRILPAEPNEKLKLIPTVVLESSNGVCIRLEKREDGVSLEGGIVTVSDNGNTTNSTLSFTPTAADNGLILTCKASNQRIPFSELQRTWMLEVLYPPRVSLNLGHGLNGNNIKEGSDVYFECHLEANPKVHRVWWLRDGEKLLTNNSAGVIVSNQTLILQRVTRHSSGRYCCEATNKEGTTKSPIFHLRVKFEPVCGDVTRKVLGAAKDEPLTVDCKVDAEPMATVFRWSFNSTPGVFRELTDFKNEAGGISVLTYMPKVAADYGTLQCWGQNDIGTQMSPCIFHVTPASRPDPPHSCSVSNVSHHSVSISCKKGFDGGLRQKFVLTLLSGDVIIANLSSQLASDFNISNLEATHDYLATIYAVNAKGPSKQSVPLAVRTLPAPSLKEQRRSTGPTDGALKASTGPLMYILLAAGSTLIIAAAVGVIIFAVRKFKVDSPVRHPRVRSPKIEESPLTAHVQPLYTDSASDENNPDLIPEAPNSEALLTTSVTPYTITPRPSSKRNCATQMPIKPYHVTWAPILQSRNCSTQTPPPHKESSV